MPMNKHQKLRVLFLFLIIVLSAYFFIHYDLLLLFKDKSKLLNFIRSYPYDQVIFVIIQITQVVATPIPGELTGIIGGILYGPLWGTIYSTIGLTLGSWIAFMLARFFGEPLLEKVVSKETFAKFEHFMEHKGLFVSFLLFLIPGFPKDYLCYIMGVSLIPAGTFIIISTVGRIFGTIMLSITGSFARDGQYLFFIVFWVIGAIIFIMAFYYRDKLIEFLKKRKA